MSLVPFNREGIIFYFKSLYMIWGFVLALQLAIVGVSLYLILDPSVLGGQLIIPELIYLIFLPLAIFIVVGFLFKKKMPEIRQTKPLHYKLAAYRKLLTINWMLLLFAAMDAAVIAIFTRSYLLLAINACIIMFMIVMRTSVLTAPNQLAMGKEEFREFQGYFKKF